MEVKKAIEGIKKFGSISKKLIYYNNNFQPLIQVGFYSEPEGFKFDGVQHELFCLCNECKDKSPISDFETYRDIRNKATRLIGRFFRITKDYKTKVEFYFKISQDCGTTMFPLFSVPAKLEDFVNKNLYNKDLECTIDITPKGKNEISILKEHLKNRLLFDKSRAFMSQFTFDKRVENLKKLLKNKIDKESRNDIFRTEYDKIRKSKVNRDSKKTFDKILFKILVVAEQISLERHNEFYNRIFDIEITILAEDTNNYEEYLNGLNEKNNSPKGFISSLSNIKGKENPYPKIFKDYPAYIIFLNLFNEFGDTKENLVNYSFIFYKMTYEDLIHSDLKQQSYFSFLSEFDISIDRIKPYATIGKIEFRESIYTKVK
jgi:hypothetical protein